MLPMLATKGDHVPTGAGWTHEVKWDGMRVLVDRTPDRLRIWSRNENDVTVSFPSCTRWPPWATTSCSTARWSRSVRAIPSFGALADRMHVRDATRAVRLSEKNPVTLIAFDLLRLDGEDLCDRPLSERRGAAPRAGARHGPDRMGAWHVPPTYDDGPMLLSAAEQQGLEGIVSKRTVLALPPRPAQQGLAEVPDPPHRLVRRRRIPPRDRQHQPARRRARRPAHRRGARVPRSGRQRHRRQGGPAAGRPADADGRGLLTLRRPSCRGSTGSARCGWSRPWWSTCSTSGSPPTVGSGSPRTVASAPT